MVGNCPFQDYIAVKGFDSMHQRWLDGEQSFHAKQACWQWDLDGLRYAVISLRPDGRLRPLTAVIAKLMYEQGDSPTAICDLFEVDPKLGVSYVKKLIDSIEDEGSGIVVAKRLRKQGLTTNMIASRIGTSTRTVRNWLQGVSDTPTRQH